MQCSICCACYSLLACDRCAADLGKYMNRSTSNSGGSSSGSHSGAGGVVGSSVAPAAYGIPFMPQPQTIPTQSPSISQGDFLASALFPCTWLWASCCGCCYAFVCSALLLPFSVVAWTSGGQVVPPLLQVLLCICLHPHTCFN